MNYSIILVIFCTFGIVKGTHEIYNRGYNDGYMDGIEDCKSNTTHHITYIINNIERLEELMTDKSKEAEGVLTIMMVLIILILVHIVLVTLFMGCRKILMDVKREEETQNRSSS